MTEAFNTGMVEIVTPPCPFCGHESTIKVDPRAYSRWIWGTLIQDAFPDWSADQRELLMTGAHSGCWDSHFGGTFDMED